MTDTFACVNCAVFKAKENEVLNICDSVFDAVYEMDVFVKNCSQVCHKPRLSRDEAINSLTSMDKNANNRKVVTMKIIREFKDEYAFLSNFYECPVIYNNRSFTSSEAAFHAEKCLLEIDKDKFIDLSPSESKKLGRKIQLRPDWEDVKEEIMMNIVRQKFLQNDDLMQKLLATENAYLMEGNYWKDQFWGVCPETGIPGIDGLNVLGQILMRLRAEFKFYRKQEERY